MVIDGLSLSALVIELNNILTGGRVEKIYQIDKATIVMCIRQFGKNYRLIISANAETAGVYVTNNSPENPDIPPAFCMLLRKHLEAGRISRVFQHSLDRVIVIEFDVRDAIGHIVTKSLIIEVMGKHSNIIFTDNNIIVDAVKRVGANVNRYRQILPGLVYKLPPGQQRLNLLTISVTDLLNILKAKNGGLREAIISTLAGIGNLTATEIMWRAGLSADISLQQLDDANLLSIGEALTNIKKALSQGNITPNAVFDKDNKLKVASAIRLEHLKQPEFIVKKFSTMNELIMFISTYQKIKPVPDKIILGRLIESLITRLLRKQKLLIDELAVAQNAEVFRKYGDLLMANIYNINNRAEYIIVDDFYSEIPDKVKIPLDIMLTPIENAQAYYNKYAKLKRANEMLLNQLSKCADEIRYLETVLLAVNNAESSLEISEIRQELILQGYLKAAKKRFNISERSVPIKIVTSDGTSILVGKNNQQNDYVTFKLANLDDIWLHTKDIPGSHVIIQLGNQQLSDGDLHIAAQLAAYFSKARKSSNVPVDYVRRRYVKKPAGAKPGFVIYTNQKTIFVTPDEALVKSLLNN